MSSSSTTNMNIIVFNQNTQQTYSSLGLGPVPAGTTADALVATVQKALFKALTEGWPAKFPAYDSSQQNSGIMGPWSANVGNTTPSCVVQQITLDFNSWGLPNDSTTITAMTAEITEQIEANGGLTGTFYGKRRLGGSETIYWGVGFGTGAIQDNPEQLGIIFVFAAVFGTN